MNNEIHQQLRFSDLRHLDTPAPDRTRATLPEALLTIFLVNATIAASFAVFYQLVMLCAAVDVSAWWAAAGYVALYALWWHRQCSAAVRLQPQQGE